MIKWEQLHPIFKEILKNKGIDSENKFRIIFSENISDLIKPSNLPDIEWAKNLIEKSKKILIWGHEDTDGITSTAIMLKTLKELEKEVDYYIPSRKLHPTPGLIPEVIKEIGKKFDLILTVDCASNDKNQVEEIKKLGLEIVITDHHEVKNNPQGVPVVNPKLGGSFPYLAGAGVSLKVSWYLKNKIEDWAIAYASLGTIADRVPLWSENRIIVINGIKILKEKYNEILNSATPEEIAFYLNNVSSKENGKNDGVEYLLNPSKELFEKFKENYEKRQNELEQLIKKAEENALIKENYLIVDMGNLLPRLLGFIAGRLKEKYQVMCIAFSRTNDETIQAEVRSPKWFNSLKFLDYSSDIFISYGGHKPACGFSMPIKFLPELYENLENFFLVFPGNSSSLIDKTQMSHFTIPT